MLILPGDPGSFITRGVTPVPGAGTVYPRVLVTAAWGTLEADMALRSRDRSTLVVPAPTDAEGSALEGDGWTLTLQPGWVLGPGNRPGDLRLVPGP